MEDKEVPSLDDDVSSTTDELRCLREKLERGVSPLAEPDDSLRSDNDESTNDYSTSSSSISFGADYVESVAVNTVDHDKPWKESWTQNPLLAPRHAPDDAACEIVSPAKQRQARQERSTGDSNGQAKSFPLLELANNAPNDCQSSSCTLRAHYQHRGLEPGNLGHVQMTACGSSFLSAGVPLVASPLPSVGAAFNQEMNQPPHHATSGDDDSFPFFDIEEDPIEVGMQVQVNNQDGQEYSRLNAKSLLQQASLRPASDQQRSSSPTSIAADESELFQIDNTSLPSPAKQLLTCEPGRVPDDEVVFNRRPKSETDHAAEISFSLYQPPPYTHRHDPILHHLTLLNRPYHNRRNIPVSQVFDQPTSLLWKSKFESFNHMQSEIANVLAHSNDNIVVSAPTGAGKTAVFEMAMARMFSTELNEQRGVRGNNQLSKRRKIVYIAPSKALCEERFDDWSSRLSQMKLGIEAALITGDAEHGDCFRDAVAAHVILTTPEKWDSLTRRWTEIFFLCASVKLFLIDEVHLLGDGSRGCCLESIVCRMKTIQRAATAVRVTEDDLLKSSYRYTTPAVIASSMRIVAVSATLPNLSDVASFLDANEAYSFDESYRPVRLTTHVKSFGFVGNKEYFFWNSLSKKVPEVIRAYAKERPTIVFCHSKKETESLAELLSTERGVGYSHGTVKSDIAAQSKVTKLQKVLLRGIAFHHAGLEAADRRLVEKAFASGHLRCLCATSTLAMGVNLPAHLVVVKGTRTWRGGYEEIDAGTLLQMIGRAGRPGYDTSGTAVIMTDNSSKSRIEKLSTGGLGAADSQLRSSLVEVFNTEISQRVITSSLTAFNWLKGTFFFVRADKNPASFGVHVTSTQSLDAHLMYLCETAIKQLRDHGIVATGNQDEIVPSPASHVMNQHMVPFDAMQRLVALPFDANQCQVVEALSEMEAMQKPVRRDEKKHLNEAHKSIKYKLKGPASKTRIQTPSQKSFVLIQAAVGQYFFDDPTLRQEMSTMAEYSCRMLAAAEEYSVVGSNHGRVALQSLKLRRSLATSLWGENDGVLNQLRGVGQSTTGSLRLNGICHFHDVMRSTEEDLEKKGHRMPPFGKQLKEAVSKILLSTLTLTASLESCDDVGERNNIRCTLKRNDSIFTMEPSLASRKDTKTPAVTYTMLAFTDKPGGCLFFQANVTNPGEVEFRCPNQFDRIFIHLVASLVGLDEKVVVESCGALSSAEASKPPPQLNEDLPRKRIRDPLLWLNHPDVQKEKPNSSHRHRVFVASNGLAAPNVAENRISQASKPVRGEPATLGSIKMSQAVTPSPKVAATMLNSGEITTARPLNQNSTLNSVTPPFSNPKTNESISPLPRIHTGTVPWNREKREHQRSQQMAFAKRTDNPFSLFRFDPNAIESNIEALSTSVPSSSGPNDKLQALRWTANQRAEYGPSKSMAGSKRAEHCFGPLTRRVRRRREFPSSIGERNLLQMKADEFYAVSATGPCRPHCSDVATQHSRIPVFAEVCRNKNSENISPRYCEDGAPHMDSQFWPQKPNVLYSASPTHQAVYPSHFTDSYQGVSTHPANGVQNSNPLLGSTLSSPGMHRQYTDRYLGDATIRSTQSNNSTYQISNMQMTQPGYHNFGLEASKPPYAPYRDQSPSLWFTSKREGEAGLFEVQRCHEPNLLKRREWRPTESFQTNHNLEEDRLFDEAFY